MGGLISGDDKIQVLQTSKNRKMAYSMLNVEKLFLSASFFYWFLQKLASRFLYSMWELRRLFRRSSDQTKRKNLMILMLGVS